MGYAIDGVQVRATAPELNTLEGVLTGAGINYYVTKTGNDANDGLSWGQAFLTIGQAMDTITARGAERGRASVFVGPGGYTEDIITPLNTIAPFGQLIAVNPTPDRSFGAVFLKASTASTATITVRARGWLIQGFEIDNVASGVGVLLDGATANSSGQGTEIRNCIFVGENQAGTGINVTKNGAPYTHIRNCHFSGYTSQAITCTESATDQPRFWLIKDCEFVDNTNHIKMAGKGFKESQIRDCAFYDQGANQNATLILDNTGGSDCLIGPNNILAGTYSISGGYKPGATEVWLGNYNSVTVATVSGGNSTASADPA